MAAEHAARRELVDRGVEVTGLVLTITFDDGHGWAFAVGSKVPDPPPPMLARSLYASAVEAGLRASGML